ncbi:MAG TPA: hypothetical protein PLS49_03815, partial [Candidatus Woesebacteria bacterium]|nr:hypothetical protein [Candidatus Woesebacteria bacterium]
MTVERFDPHSSLSSYERSEFTVPIGTKIDDPISLSEEDWQERLNKISMDPNIPEGFLDSAFLTYSAARGIEEVFKDQDSFQIPSITIYIERAPNMLKNFFSAKDMSIYLHARWLAKRAQLPPETQHKFVTEKTDELLFEGTPAAYATLLGMEEAQHALDFQTGILKSSESTGMQYRSENLVEHDSKDSELRALYQNLARMKQMPRIFSYSSLQSIENR